MFVQEYSRVQIFTDLVPRLIEAGAVVQIFFLFCAE